MVWRNKKAFAVIEYIMLIIIIMGALIVFKDVIKRAFFGRWKMAGESFGFGRQYDPKKTVECAYGQMDADKGIWYDATCYEEKVRHGSLACAPGDWACEDKVKKTCASDEIKSYCCADLSIDQKKGTNCE